MADLISIILPPSSQTIVLRTALWEGAEATLAWSAWRTQLSESKEGPEQELSRIKRLLPLLAIAQRHQEVELEKNVQTHLRTAYTRESFRCRTMRHICRPAFQCLIENQIPFIVLKGIAIAEAVYPDPATRHSHDCDLLVEHESHVKATQALATCGFSPFAAPRDVRPDCTQVVHERGLPIHMHTSLFELPTFQVSYNDLWDRSISRSVCGVNVRVLSDEDSLLNVCGHASYSISRQHLCWVADSWMLLQRSPQFDWDALCERARAARLCLPLSILLGHLADELSAPIPKRVLARLGDRTSTTLLGHEAAIFGAVRGSPGQFWKMVKLATGLGAWALLLKWMLLPAPSHMRWAYNVRYSWLLPFYYFFRPLRGILRRVVPGKTAGN